MQYVEDHWYRIYRVFSTVLQVLLAIAYVASLFYPPLKPYRGQLGLSEITLGISLVHVAYATLFYPRFYRNDVAMATIITGGLLSLNVICLINATSQHHAYYLLLWFLVILMSGIFGSGAVLGTCYLATAYLIILRSNTGSHGKPILQIGLLVGSYAIALVSYLIWRPKYLNHEGAKVRQLNSLLSNRQKQSEVVLQSITDGVIATNGEGKIGLINEAASKLTGWGVEEANGLDINSIINLQDDKGAPVPKSLYPFIQALGKKSSVSQVVRLVARGSQDPQIVSLITTPVLAPGGKQIIGTVSVFRDISEERNEEQKRAEFISTASHEMRTPVAAIEGYLALAMNDKITKIDSKARNYLQKAQSSTTHLGQLFQDLLASAKAEDGRLTSHPVVVELGGYLTQVCDDLRFSAEKKGLLMEFIIGINSGNSIKADHQAQVYPLYYIETDPDRLREVITNIFDNAVKYTDSGKITIGLTGDDKIAQIRITDTGPGIPADDVPHLFQKFYRVDSSATRTIGGTGLGLFITKKIVELYHGQIWVESEQGKGSTFFVNFPRLDTQQALSKQTTELQSPNLALP